MRAAVQVRIAGKFDALVVVDAHLYLPRRVVRLIGG
jgi:hypothetical protein